MSVSTVSEQMQNSEEIWGFVDTNKPDFESLSDRIWDRPEIAYTEQYASGEHLGMLAAKGFTVTKALAGIPTAVQGEAGEGGPVIAILGEYDALPGLSQEAGVFEPRPIAGEGHGHGCGHNLLGSGALLAATAIKDWLHKSGLPGRVRYYGCPAEEGGAGKTFMAREGVFSDVDIAISWHPASFTRVEPALSLANTRIDFIFTGVASHAAMAPHLGRSALDGVELMNVGVNYLREHVPPDSRIHYAMIDGGGIAPNVVQARAIVRYAIRSATLPDMFALIERVKRVANGAAMMTDTNVEVRVVSAVSNLLPNTPLEETMYACMERLGPVPFDDLDRDAARKMQATVSAENIHTDFQRVGLRTDRAMALCDTIVPLHTRGVPMVGSTDVGDVSWIVPTVQARVATQAVGTPGHSWQMTAQGKMPAAHKGMVYAAKIMAATAVELLLHPERIEAAKEDFRQRTAEHPYQCPIPADVAPPISTR